MLGSSDRGGDGQTRLRLKEQLLVLPAAKAWQQVPGEAGGTWFAQDQHSWPSLWLAERGFLRHRSDWPVILLQPAETERDAVKAIHLSGAGASHISLTNNGHFAHGEALIWELKGPSVGQDVGRGRKQREALGRILYAKKSCSSRHQLMLADLNTPNLRDLFGRKQCVCGRLLVDSILGPSPKWIKHFFYIKLKAVFYPSVSAMPYGFIQNNSTWERGCPCENIPYIWMSVSCLPGNVNRTSFHKLKNSKL